MLEGFEIYLGRKLKPEHIHSIKHSTYVTTRPDHCGPNTHINMHVHFDANGILTDVTGDKCYAHYSGMWNRSASVRDGKFTKKDLAYLRRYIEEITSPI